jgi:hypothetical protein
MVKKEALSHDEKATVHIAKSDIQVPCRVESDGAATRNPKKGAAKNG